MGPSSKSTAGRAAASASTDQTIPQTDLQEELLAAQAEIEALRAQLADRSSRDSSPSNSGLVTVLEMLAQRLDRTATPTDRPQRSAKVADPPVLTNGIDPTFDNWKLQLRDKLEVNADHFPSIRARMAYVFGRTGGDAQTHLRPRYAEESADAFESDEGMVAHLASIYEDPYKVQNARLDYRSLMMKPSETFTEFQTRFLHLAGQARIPTDDLVPDLFDKLTLDLQRAVLPTYPNLRTLKELMQQCQALDQGLRRIKARAERTRTRKPTYGSSTDQNPPLRAASSLSPPAAQRTTREGSPATPAFQERPTYDDPRKQRLSDQGACFSCGQKDHFVKDCPSANARKADVGLIWETEAEDSGKEEP
jgi:hypothetical protein